VNNIVVSVHSNTRAVDLVASSVVVVEGSDDGLVVSVEVVASSLDVVGEVEEAVVVSVNNSSNGEAEVLEAVVVARDVITNGESKILEVVVGATSDGIVNRESKVLEGVVVSVNNSSNREAEVLELLVSKWSVGSWISSHELEVLEDIVGATGDGIVNGEAKVLEAVARPIAFVSDRKTKSFVGVVFSGIFVTNTEETEVLEVVARSRNIVTDGEPEVLELVVVA